MSRTIIHNALIINEGERFIGYVIIEDGLIAEISQGNVDEALLSSADFTEDADGAYLLPGAIDEHVHFREPGLTNKADTATESAAAVAGGVTSFIDMPNTKPLTTSIEALETKHQRASEVSMANYSYFIGATNDNLNELLACDYSIVPGVKLFLGSSTGNMLVDNEIMLNRLFGEVKSLIAVHAESEPIIQSNRQRLVNELGENLPIKLHSIIRDRKACYESTATAIALANKHNARLHVMHISTLDELSLFKAGDIASKRITAETCPHYLWFDSRDYDRMGGRIKCNPAIKSSRDREALLSAVADSIIDVIATDHAPHLLEEKQGTALTSTSGMPMVQYSLPLMLELADRGHFSIEQVVDKMSHAPATLLGVDRRGYIRIGYHADLVIVKPHSPYSVNDHDVVSRCQWTPLNGETLHNQVISTYINGIRAYHHGHFNSTVRGIALKFNH